MGRREREKLDELTVELTSLKHMSEMIQTVLMVREPESVTAASAYEGLRKQIVASAKERWTHLAQLAQIDTALQEETTDLATLQRLSDEWLEQAGVHRIVEVPKDRDLVELFDVLDSRGEVAEVVRPAYVDPQTDRVVKMGRVRMVPRKATASAREGAELVPPAEDPLMNGDHVPSEESA